jgi:hypothetical protein
MGVRVSFLEEAPKNERGDSPFKPPNASQTDAAAPAGVLVPSNSIVQRDGHSVVFKLDGDEAHAVTVTAGQTYGDLRLVQGLSSGARVVRSPPAQMQDGARVVVNKR